MTDAILRIQIPAPLLQFGLDEEGIQRRVREWLVISLFTEGRVSSGKAARLLEMSRYEFLRLLRARSVAYIDYSTEETAEEMEAADELAGPDATC